MAIKGELPSTDLSNVFQMLALNRKRGRLYVREQGNLLGHRRLYIFENQVALDERPAPRPLGPLMVEMGVVSYADYRAALERGEQYRSDPVHLLRQQGTITDEDLKAVAIKVEEEGILEVFLWRSIFFNLEEGGADPIGGHFFSVDHLIMEAARRQDEWRHHSEVGLQRPRVFESGRESAQTRDLTQLEPIPHIVLDAVDGVKGSHQITQVTGLSRYHVDLALHQLHQAGLVQPIDRESLIASGDRLFEENRPEDAIRMYRCALPDDRNDIGLHQRFARAHQSLGRLAKAGAHLRYAAELFAESGHVRETVDTLQEVLAVLPTDFRSLQRAVAILASSPIALTEADTALLAQADKLLLFFLDTDQHESALTLAEALYQLRPQDASVLATLAKLRLRAGRQEEAADAYLGLAEKKVQDHDDLGALEIYRTLVGLAPSRRARIEPRIAEIQRRLSRQQTVERTSRRGIAVAAVLIVVALLAFGYCHLARSALEAIPAMEPDRSESIKQRQAALDRMRGRFPLTPAAIAAKSESEQLRAQIEGAEKEERDREEVRRAESREKRNQAGRALAESKGLLGLRKTVKAYERCREAVRLFDEIQDQTPAAVEARELAQGLSDRVRIAEGHLTQLREAKAKSDRARVHAHAQSLAVDYRELAEANDLVLPVEIVGGPSGIQLSCPELGVSGQDRLSLDLPADQRVTIHASRAGMRTETLTLAWPEVAHRVPIVLAASDGPVTNSAPFPLSGLAAVDSNTAVLVGREGSLATWRTGQGVGSVIRPTSLRSVRLPSTLAGGSVVTVSETGSLSSYSPAENRVAWETDLGFSPAGLAADSRTVVVADGSGKVIAVEPGSGRERWRAQLEKPTIQVCVNQGHIGCRQSDGTLTILDAQTGREVHRSADQVGGLIHVTEEGSPVVWIRGRGLVRRQARELTLLHAESESAPFLFTPTRTPQGVFLACQAKTLHRISASGTLTLELPDSPLDCRDGTDGQSTLLLPGDQLVTVGSGPHDYRHRVSVPQPLTWVATSSHLLVVTRSGEFLVFNLKP